MPRDNPISWLLALEWGLGCALGHGLAIDWRMPSRLSQICGMVFVLEFLKCHYAGACGILYSRHGCYVEGCEFFEEFFQIGFFGGASVV